MKQIKKIQWEVRRYWRLWFGSRLERFVQSVRWRCVGQASEAVRAWRAFGSPSEFVPRRALRRLAFFQALRVGIVLALVAFGPWLVAVLVSRW